ncbi:hypothetical protein E2493_19590 [Sphingomonas parva]|uniref:Uncharacterized protein n=1 Tax=Sphingomonas parva TaxID=2555898 RepID=A0A4Y8ZKQ7_9SPHN|nr:hypothetical protein [Sphingomonas parva]TFI56544.1 hypothetical protein E2493_19590 [Sphingomonas parva]
MKRWRSKILLLAGVAGLGFALPALGQRETPEPLLPPGFGDQDTAPTPAPPSPDTEESGAPAGNALPPVAAEPSVAASDRPVIENAAVEDLEDLAAQEIVPPIEIPEESRRPTNIVGPLRAENWGLGFNAFGSAHGRLLTSLMGRLDAPLPSRWTSILLRRALLSEVPAPRQVNEVDWVAERAWLLLRMGEADSARMLVQAIDVDQYTPRMFTVAVQTALATADPAALCPLVGPGKAVSEERFWPLAEAMCAALSGDAARASALIDQQRRRMGETIDLLLAEKVVGAGTNTRRAVTIQWDGVDSVNSWRFGLASATGLKIPDALMRSAGPHVRAWEAQAPMIPIEQRLKSAQDAATIGVFSNAALVDIHSLVGDATDPSEIEASVAGRLRRAYASPTYGARIGAMRDLWGDEEIGGDRYGRLILTAAAAAEVPALESQSNRAEDLIASAMSAGFDRRASRWGRIVDAMGDDGDRAWSILAVGTPRPVVDVSRSRVEAFVDRDGGHRGRMLVAALAGLGRLEDPASLGVDPAPRSRWAQMITAAARNRQPGTVALLAAVGMQTGGWQGVPPHHLYQMLRALRQVGLDYEARMIAAEAMTRL